MTEVAFPPCLCCNAGEHPRELKPVGALEAAPGARCRRFGRVHDSSISDDATSVFVLNDGRGHRRYLIKSAG